MTRITILCFVLLLIACNSQGVKNDSQSVGAETGLVAGQPADTAQFPSAISQKTMDLDSSFNVHDLFKVESSDVVNTLAQENFELAIKKIEKYFHDPNLELTETQLASFRYMHIYSFIGLVIQKKKTHQELKTILESYKDQYLITQHLEITKGNAMPFNQMRVEQDKENTIMITCANNEGFNIHCFVRAEMKTKIDLEKSLGKRAYLCGKLVNYKLSEDDIYSWIADLSLTEGFVKILEDEYEK